MESMGTQSSDWVQRLDIMKTLLTEAGISGSDK